MVAPFAQHGTTERGVDVSAPGVSVQSLRVPDGFVDQNVTTGKDGTRFQRASGTSQSSAIVAGLAALILSKVPVATPDLVKALLTSGTTPVKADEKNKKEYVGTGVGNLLKVANMSVVSLLKIVLSLLPPAPSGTGTGTIEDARGSYHVTAGDVELRGELDIFGRAWSSAAVARATAYRSGWDGGIWNGSQWTSNWWSNGTWAPVTWSGSDWTGASWDETSVDGDASEWSGARWSGARWSGARWSGARWSGARWSDASWT